MILVLLVAFGLTATTVTVHALGTLEAITHLARPWWRGGIAGRVACEIQVIRTVSVLLLLHLIEATLWAAAYWVVGLLPDMETAVYFSLTSYTTIGYGDVVLPPPWRLLGPIEGAIGILMFGWSTAVMVAVVRRVYGDRLRFPTEPAAEANRSRSP